jgi:hypothetical protein
MLEGDHTSWSSCPRKRRAKLGWLEQLQEGHVPKVLKKAPPEQFRCSSAQERACTFAFLLQQLANEFHMLVAELIHRTSCCAFSFCPVFCSASSLLLLCCPASKHTLLLGRSLSTCTTPSTNIKQTESRNCRNVL